LTLKSSAAEPPVVWFNLVVEPAKSGENQIHLSTETPEGGIAKPMQVTMELTNASHNVGPLQVCLVRLAPATTSCTATTSHSQARGRSRSKR
jgi:hypothetical protein